jgi:hypothetical protein
VIAKQTLVDLMLELLQKALEEQRTDQGSGGAVVTASATQPLVGEHAVLTSIGLVSLISDIEETLLDAHGLSVTLVSEQALSRKRSPFRNIDVLADYVLELTGAPVAESASVEAGAA